MKASLPASLRKVRGRPTSAAQPSAAVIPGTTTTGAPAARRYSSSSPPRPNTKGSPPLSRTTRRPARAAASSSIEHSRGHQLVVEHHIGVREGVERTQGQKIRIARAGADQKHRFGSAVAALASAVTIDRGHEPRLRLVGTPRENRLGNGTCDDVLPKAARRQRARDGRKSAAVSADQSSEVADAGGQQGLDQLAQPPRQDRRGSAGADRDHHLAAIDDGGKNERREVRPVDDIDGDAVAAGAGGDLSVERVARRGNDGDGIAQIGLEWIGEADFEPARSRQRQHRFRDVDVARQPAHVRAGGDNNDDASSGIEEDREEPHRALRNALTSIIFYIIVAAGIKIEKYYSNVPKQNRKYHHGRRRSKKASLAMRAGAT